MPRVRCPALSAALASNSGENLDGHFGSCLRYLIYQVSDSEIRLVDIRSALEADYAEDRNAFRANLIKDCQVLYAVSIGGPVTCKVIRADVWPMKKTEGGPAGDVLQGVQVAMQGTPPPWPAKIMGVTHEKRLKFYSGAEEA